MIPKFCNPPTQSSGSTLCHPGVKTMAMVWRSQHQHFTTKISRPRPWPWCSDLKTNTLPPTSQDLDRGHGVEISTPTLYHQGLKTKTVAMVCRSRSLDHNFAIKVSWSRRRPWQNKLECTGILTSQHCMWYSTGACVEDKLWQVRLQRSSGITQGTVTWWTDTSDNRTHSTEVDAAVFQPDKGYTSQLNWDTEWLYRKDNPSGLDRTIGLVLIAYISQVTTSVWSYLVDYLKL